MAAFNLAIEDINAYLSRIGSEKRVVGEISETGSTPVSVSESLIELRKAGVPLVIAFLSSAQVEQVRDYLNEQGILLLTTGCSSPALAIPGDNIIRFNPDDTTEAHITSSLIKNEGFSHIISLARNDIWAQGLVKGVQESLPEDITMDEGVWYEPDTSDYSTVIRDLDVLAGTIGEEIATERIAIYAVTFGEIDSLLAEAKKPEYNNLSGIKWIGCDGNALVPQLTGTSDAAESAIMHNFTAITFAPGMNADQIPEYQILKNRLNGIDPDGYTMAAYDAVWIAFKSLLPEGKQDSNSLREAVLAMANQHYGVTDECQMNDAGDRITGIYNIWGLENGKTGVTWKLDSYVGVWGNISDPNNIEIIPVNE